jgi:hypothetical protein
LRTWWPGNLIGFHTKRLIGFLWPRSPRRPSHLDDDRENVGLDTERDCNQVATSPSFALHFSQGRDCGRGGSLGQRYAKNSPVAMLIAPNAGRAASALPCGHAMACCTPRESPSAKRPRCWTGPAARCRRGGRPTTTSRPGPREGPFFTAGPGSPSCIAWSSRGLWCASRVARAGCAWGSGAGVDGTPAIWGGVVWPPAARPPPRGGGAGGVPPRREHACGPGAAAHR